MGTSSKSKRKCIGRDTRDFTPTPVIILSNRNSSVTDHSYRDFSTCPVPNEDKKLVDYSSDNSESMEMSFGLKLHEILHKKEYNGYITWMPHGRAFRIMIPKRLEMKVLPKYFNHSRYSTFMRQLNNHGFKHLTQGQDRNCHYHEVSAIADIIMYNFDYRVLISLTPQHSMCTCLTSSFQTIFY